MNQETPPFMLAGPVREHLALLRSAGAGVDRIAQLAGVPGSTVRELIYGSGGRHFERVRLDIADRILRMRPAAHIRSERGTVDATRTRALVESVRDGGVPWTVIADGLGRSVGSLRRTLQRPRVTVRTATDVARFCMNIEASGDSESGVAAAG